MTNKNYNPSNYNPMKPEDLQYYLQVISELQSVYNSKELDDLVDKLKISLTIGGVIPVLEEIDTLIGNLHHEDLQYYLQVISELQSAYNSKELDDLVDKLKISLTIGVDISVLEEIDTLIGNLKEDGGIN